jgi:6-pyruvoyltetrahydropterin/6-carboxytetrahydropterin synthase
MWELCRIAKEYAFEAAHMLPKVSEHHKCHRLHGHNYKVEVELRGEIAGDGFCNNRDFADIDDQVKPIIARLDHRYLNDIEGLENPTAENIAAYLLKEINAERSIFFSVKVWETPKCWAMVINKDGLFRAGHKE